MHLFPLIQASLTGLQTLRFAYFNPQLVVDDALPRLKGYAQRPLTISERVGSSRGVMQGMTRQEMLYLLLLQARSNGFQFRRWYCTYLNPEWLDFGQSLNSLATGKRYYALLFSHDFARCFWKPGAQISFIVPTASYTRKNKQGEMVTITRKAFTRRTLKEDSWRYHLSEMVVAEEPLRYIRRFIVRQEDLEHYRAMHPATIDRSFAEESEHPAGSA